MMVRIYARQYRISAQCVASHQAKSNIARDALPAPTATIERVMAATPLLLSVGEGAPEDVGPNGVEELGLDELGRDVGPDVCEGPDAGDAPVGSELVGSPLSPALVGVAVGSPENTRVAPPVTVPTMVLVMPASATTTVQTTSSPLTPQFSCSLMSPAGES